jgi:hypothetical protein
MIGLMTDHEKALAADGGELASVITQLAEAQAFLAERMPPVTLHYPTTIGRSCASVAEVDEIAALIGATARWIDGEPQYTVERSFGTNVTYRATYIVRIATVAA